MTAYFQRSGTVRDFNGVVVSKATIKVVTGLTYSDTAPLATLYADAAGLVPLANPFQADAAGQYLYWAELGYYSEQVSRPGYYSETNEGFFIGGLPGPTGPQGAQGLTGAQGAKGDPGEITYAIAADIVDPLKGSGLIGFNAALAYAAGTIGYYLKNFVLNLADATNVLFGDALIGTKRTDTYAVAMTTHSWIESRVWNVKEFGAVGDGVTDDWMACQKAVDAANALGGSVIFPPGVYKIYRNTLIVWGSNVKLSFYGATLYKDDGGLTAGNYGDAITVFGKLPGLQYYSPGMGGTYTALGTAYAGTLTPSKNCAIEGLKVTFGTSSEYTINGISGLNFEGLTVRDCYVTNAPQTGFAFPSTDSDSLDLLLENCICDGYGVQGFRVISQFGAVSAGKVRATLQGCRSINGPASINLTNFPTGSGKISTEVKQVPTGLHILNQHGLAAMDVVVDNCDFDKTTNIFGSNLNLSVRSTKMGNIQGSISTQALDSGTQNVVLDGCTLTTFQIGQVANYSSWTTQITLTTGGVAPFVPSNWTINNTNFVDAGNSQITIVNQTSEMVLRDCTGAISYLHSTAYKSGTNNIKQIAVERCTLTMPATGSFLTFTADSNRFIGCTINSPITFTATTKSIHADDCVFKVNSQFTTNNVCFYSAGTPVARISGISNVIDWSANTAYVSVTLCALANNAVQSNAYIYSADGGTTLLFSYDVSRASAAPAAGTGYWKTGMRVQNSLGSTTATSEWVCITAGLAGASVWKAVAMA